MYNAKRAILVVMVVCVGLAQGRPSFISKDTTLYKYLMKFRTAEQTITSPEKSDVSPANISAPAVKSDCKTNKLCYQSIRNHNYKRAPQTYAPLVWTEDTTFGAAIDILTNRLPLLVLWKDLEENAGIDKDTPVGISAVPGASLQKNFQLLLLSVSAKGMEKLGYTVEGGIITVATIGSLPVTKSAMVFHVGELLSVPSTGFGTMGSGGFGGGGYGGNSGGGGYGGGGHGGWRSQKLMGALEPFVRPAER